MHQNGSRLCKQPSKTIVDPARGETQKKGKRQPHRHEVNKGHPQNIVAFFPRKKFKASIVLWCPGVPPKKNYDDHNEATNRYNQVRPL